MKNNYASFISRINIFLILILAGCKSHKDAHSIAALKQRVEARGQAMEVIPFQGNDSVSDAVLFKARLFLTKNVLEDQPGLSSKLQYGADSLFCLVSPQGIVWPDHVLPIATGQRLQPEFLVSFSRHSLTNVRSILFSTYQNGAWAKDELQVAFDVTKILSLYPSTN